MFNKKLTKYTGYYRCIDDIRNFKVQIRLKESNPDIASLQSEGWLTKEFSWQEKHFSTIEREFYKDVKNCITDVEKEYNEKILNEFDDEHNPLLFTYVDQDGYVNEFERQCSSDTYLQNMMESMNITLENDDEISKFDYETLLQNSIQNPIIEQDIEKMYIMVDLGEYVDDVWIRNEQLLCLIKFDKSSKILSVYPDFTTTQAYLIKVSTETIRQIYYYVENTSMNIPEAQALEEQVIIKKITDYKKSLSDKILGQQFFMPPKDKLYVYLFCEILGAKYFENNDVFIQYTIDLPEHWACDNMNTLTGLTQTCHANSDDGLMHFNHNFEVILHCDIQSLNRENGLVILKNPSIYFEAISKGTWERYTTEGFSYTCIPVSNPGYYTYNLSCFRFDSRGSYGNLRRFFIGDSFNSIDVKSIGIPSSDSQVNIINNYALNTVGTGQISFKVDILHQSQAFLNEYHEGERKERYLYEKLNASSLIRSVNQVLMAFRKAKKNLAEARKNV